MTRPSQISDSAWPWTAFTDRVARAAPSAHHQERAHPDADGNPPHGLRIFSAMGSGDAALDLRLWCEGRPSPASLARTYSREMFEACRRGGHHLLAVTSHSAAASASSGRLTVRNLPKPASTGRLQYHWHQWRHGLRLLREARQFKAQVAILDSGSCTWWVAPLFRIAGMQVVIKMHNAFWSRDQALSLPRKAKLALGTALPLRIAGVSVLGVSDFVLGQARRLLGGQRIERRFLPIFPEALDRKAREVSPAPDKGLRVGYIGRIEKEKGVHLLLDAAQWLENRSVPGWRIDVVGEGSAQAALAAQIVQRHLEPVVALRGPMDSSQIEAFLGRIDVLVVPSTSAVSEALCKSLIEAALMGVPVVASRTIPSAQMLPSSCVAIDPDDGHAIAQALHQLATEPSLWRQKATGASEEKSVFRDQSHGLQPALEDLLQTLARQPR